MKTTLTSVLLLALAGILLLPEPVSAVSTTAAASATAATTLSFRGSNRRPTRKAKKVRGKQYRSSAAKAYAKRTRRASF